MEEGKNTFTIEYTNGSIKNFEKRILAEGRCSSFLPTSFIIAGDKEIADYDYSGYQKLAAIKFDNSKNMMCFLEKCIFALIESCGHMLNPKNMALTQETIFRSSDEKEIKFAYAPKRVPEKNITCVLLNFFAELENNTENKETKDYLKALSSSIEHNNCSLFGAVNCIDELKQEIYACR